MIFQKFRRNLLASNLPASTWRKGDRPSGFTLVEVLIVLVIIGIIAGIAVPSWLGFLTTRRVNRAQRDALNVLRDAQAKAQKEKRGWAACFRDQGGQLEWTVLSPTPPNNHPPGEPLTSAGVNCNLNSPGWFPLGEGDADKVAIEATSTIPQAGGNYIVAFNFRGEVADEVVGDGITFGARNVNSSTRRCVTIETLLGVLQTAEGTDCP